jgi:hypothetical protein
MQRAKPTVRFGPKAERLVWSREGEKRTFTSIASVAKFDPNQSTNHRAGDPESGHLLTEIKDGSVPILFRHF